LGPGGYRSQNGPGQRHFLTQPAQRKDEETTVARKKKASAGETLVIGAVLGIGFLVWLVSQVPVWVWVTGLGLVGAFFAYREYRKAAGVPVTGLPASAAAEAAAGTAVWVPAGHAIHFGGLSLPGGMLYVGKSLPSSKGADDPALLNTLKEIAPQGDYTRRQTDYWPSYSNITPAARRSYLRWLAGGRRDPRADVGFVFLFFYGLERRAIIDASQDDAAKADWPLIEREVRELLAVYGDNRSFRGYARGLLTWLELGSLALNSGDALYEKPVPRLQRGFELPFYMRLALGQAALAQAPLPAQFALEWARLAPEITLRKPVERCPNEFAKLFLQKYEEAFGAGLVLPKSKTLLKLTYHPASSGLSDYDITLKFGGAPDVAGLPGPLLKLQQVVEEATTALEPYSRVLAKNPNAAGSIDALLKLPVSLWPAAAQARLQSLSGQVARGTTALPLSELLQQLQVTGALTRDKVLSLAHALEGSGIGMEPDVLTGARTPKAEDLVVLFAQEQPGGSRFAVHSLARIALELSSTVAMADGEMGPSELESLRAQIDGWAGLNDSDKRRLHAHLQLLIARPVQLTALRTRIAALPEGWREGLAQAITPIAQADGELSAAEVSALDKAYKTLGVAPEKFLPETARSVAQKPARTASAKPRKAPASTLSLDMSKIAALQQDTARVSAILAGIFVEEPVPVAAEPEALEDGFSVKDGVLGLDAVHSSFARMLLSRPEWSRADLLNVAADFDVMLDGAMERINEAAFDQFDEALTEGEDPVLVNQDVLDKLAA
jgi:uncharacterized tellurite resistance protein B-like protein